MPPLSWLVGVRDAKQIMYCVKHGGVCLGNMVVLLWKIYRYAWVHREASNMGSIHTCTVLYLC